MLDSFRPPLLGCLPFRLLTHCRVLPPPASTGHMLYIPEQNVPLEASFPGGKKGPKGIRMSMDRGLVDNAQYFVKNRVPATTSCRPACLPWGKEWSGLCGR